MNKIPAVDKTIQLLTVLSEKNYSQAELSAKLNISMSTAYRILMTLQAHRWVRKKAGGIYTLAEGLLPLTRGISEDVAILEKIAEKLPGLSEKYQIACKLSVRREEEQLTVCRAEPPGPVALTGQSGSTFPLIEGSVGAALLADTSEKELRQLIRTCPADIPEKQEPQLLSDAVSEVRRQGFALNARPNRWNIAALSIPVRNSSGNIIAALTLVGCKEDFTEEKNNQWKEMLNDTMYNCIDKKEYCK